MSGLAAFLGASPDTPRAPAEFFVVNGSRLSVSGNVVQFASEAASNTAKEALIAFPSGTSFFVHSSSEVAIIGNAFVTTNRTAAALASGMSVDAEEEYDVDFLRANLADIGSNAVYKGIFIEGAGLSLTAGSAFVVERNTHDVASSWSPLPPAKRGTNRRHIVVSAKRSFAGASAAETSFGDSSSPRLGPPYASAVAAAACSLAANAAKASSVEGAEEVYDGAKARRRRAPFAPLSGGALGNSPAAYGVYGLRSAAIPTRGVGSAAGRSAGSSAAKVRGSASAASVAAPVRSDASIVWEASMISLASIANVDPSPLRKRRSLTEVDEVSS